MVVFRHHGNFNKTESLFRNALKLNLRSILEKYARQGVTALASATPKDTGVTADSWNYEIKVKNNGYSIAWTNSNTTVTGIPIVILIQYGHGTGNGGYVEGRDFINPTIKPVFDAIAQNIWKELTKL